MRGLLEREDELARLADLLDSARSGVGRVALVHGEAGIGKTGLVTAFTARARDEGGIRAAIGRCDPLATPRPLGPFLDAAAQLRLPAGGSRDALLGALLAELAIEPTILAVEDAHWADAASLELLAMLGRRAVDLPLLLVVTYRDSELGPDHRLGLLLGDLAAGGGASWLGLRPLSEDAVQELAGESGTELYRLTGGNPFYVTEVLAAPADGIPQSVRLAVLARAARLPAGERETLDAVSVVPGRAPTWLVEALCAPSPVVLDACLRSGVLLASAGGYEFRHELARHAVEDDLPAARRRELHQRAALALAGRPDGDPARVAHHAEAAGDVALLAHHARLASLQAIAGSSYREAVLQGERALLTADQLHPDEVAELQTALAMPCYLLDRPEQGIALATASVEHWRATGDERREAAALVAMAPVLSSNGRTADAVAAETRAIELLERFPPSPELAEAYDRLSSSYMLARDRDASAAWGERAIALATQLGDHATLGRSLITTGIADVMDGNLAALSRIHEGIEVARRHGLHAVVSLGYLQIGSGCGEMRHYEEATAALDEALATATAHELSGHRRYVLAWSARCRFDLGQWDDAERLAREALVGSSGELFTRFVALNTLGWLRARRGDDDTWPPLDEALQLAQGFGHLQRLWPSAVARSEAGWLDGSLQEHVALLEHTLELAVECRHAVAIGELGVWLQRAGSDTAVPVDHAAEPFASWLDGRPLDAATGFRRLGCAYEAALALTDTTDATSLREALATFERLGAAPMASKVRAELKQRGVRVPTRRGADAPADSPFGLTARELEVLHLVAAGLTNPQIAGRLYVSRKTAEHHVSSILLKLGVTSRVEAATAATRLGLLPA